MAAPRSARWRRARPPGGVAWTPEEAARFAARRDFELLRLLSTDAAAFAVARRLHFFTRHDAPSGAHQRVPPSGGAARNAPASGAAGTEENDTARPEGARAADPARPPQAAGAAPDVHQVVAHPRRPRKRSAAQSERVQVDFENKWKARRWRSSKLLSNIFSAWAARRRADNTTVQSGPGGSGGMVTAARGAQSTSTGGEVGGEQREGGVAAPAPATMPAAGLAAGSADGSAAVRVRAPEPYVQHWRDEWGRPHVQVFGRCGGCADACVLEFREDGGRGWLCAQCWLADGLFD